MKAATILMIRNVCEDDVANKSELILPLNNTRIDLLLSENIL